MFKTRRITLTPDQAAVLIDQLKQTLATQQVELITWLPRRLRREVLLSSGVTVTCKPPARRSSTTYLTVGEATVGDGYLRVAIWFQADGRATNVYQV